MPSTMAKPKAKRYKTVCIGSKIIKNCRTRSSRSFIPLKEYKTTICPSYTRREMSNSDRSSSILKEDNNNAIVEEAKLTPKIKVIKPQSLGVAARNDKLEQMRCFNLKSNKEKRSKLETKPISNDNKRTTHASSNKNCNRALMSPVNNHRKLTRASKNQSLPETIDVLRYPIKGLVDNNLKRKTFSFNKVTNTTRNESSVRRNLPELDDYSDENPKSSVLSSVVSNLSTTTLNQNDKGANKNKKNFEVTFKIYIKEVDMYCSDIAKYSDLYAKRKIRLGDYLRLRQSANSRHSTAKEKLEQAFLVFTYKPEFNGKLLNYCDKEFINSKCDIKDYDATKDKGCLTDNNERIFINRSVSTDSCLEALNINEDKNQSITKSKSSNYIQFNRCFIGKKWPTNKCGIEKEGKNSSRSSGKTTRCRIKVQQEMIYELIKDNNLLSKKIKLEIYRRRKVLKHFTIPRNKRLFCYVYKSANINESIAYTLNKEKKLRDDHICHRKIIGNLNETAILPSKVKMDTDNAVKMHSSPNFSFTNYIQYDTSLSIETHYINDIILDCLNKAVDKAIEKLTCPSRYNLLIKQVSSMLDKRNQMIDNLKSNITAMLSDSKSKEKMVHTEINEVMLQNDSLNKQVEMIKDSVNNLNPTTKAKDHDKTTHNAIHISQKVPRRSINTNFLKQNEQKSHKSILTQADETQILLHDVSSQTLFMDRSNFQKKDLDKFKTAYESLRIQYRDIIESSNIKEHKMNQSLSVIRDLVNEHIKNANTMRSVYTDKERELVAEIATLRDRCEALTLANRRLYMRNNEQVCELISLRNRVRSEEKTKKYTKNARHTFNSFTRDNGAKLKMDVPAAVATVSIIDSDKNCRDLSATCKKILDLQHTVDGTADLTEYKHLAVSVVNGVEMILRDTPKHRYETTPNQFTLKYVSPNISSKENLTDSFPPACRIAFMDMFPQETHQRNPIDNSVNFRRNYSEYNSQLGEIYKRIAQPRLNIYDNLADSINCILVNIRDDDNIQHLLQNMMKLLQDNDTF